MRVSCDGQDDNEPIDLQQTHPIVYLIIDEKTGQVVCPYCNKVFKK